MRRRASDDLVQAEEVPADLAAFDPEEWAAGELDDFHCVIGWRAAAITRWHSARVEWADRHEVDLPPHDLAVLDRRFCAGCI